jgi:hypothetical protein
VVLSQRAAWTIREDQALVGPRRAGQQSQFGYLRSLGLECVDRP